ncbi:MAG: hypothetical protein MUE85_07470 [Microscillaceae bacterium]|jgi:hypothetical protein|nr:hypothetical protein [Microscillaceae bacterium]
MEYNVQLQLNFEQLLQLVLQLPEIEQKRLVSVLSKPSPARLPTLRMRTVAQILAQDYQYPYTKPKHLVGGWTGEETPETLIALRTK